MKSSAESACSRTSPRSSGVARRRRGRRIRFMGQNDRPKGREAKRKCLSFPGARSFLPRFVSKNTAAKITLLQHLASFVGAALLKMLGWTLRVQWKDEASFYDPRRKSPVILCLWHNRLLAGVLGDHKAARPRLVPVSILTSASKDGGWLAAIARRFRMGSVRGSSSRRGAAALLELTRTLGEGADIAVTPDGPRGPNYNIAHGLLYLAQRTGTRIVPVEIQITRFWRIGKKWDALWIPKPFSKITLTYRPPLEIPQETTDLDAEAARLDAAMGPK